MSKNGSKEEDSKKSILDTANKLELTQEELAKHQKTIELVNERDASAYTPVTESEEKTGLSGEELLKMVKKNIHK